MEKKAIDFIELSKPLKTYYKQKRYWYSESEIQKIKIKILKFALKKPEKVYNSMEALVFDIENNK